MDNGKGLFEPKTEEEYDQAVKTNGGINYFKIGEEVEIKGSHFRVKGIRPKDLILRLLPQDR